MQHIKTQFRSFLLAPERVFVVLALFFGIASAFLMPQLATSDEWAHFLRSYNIASGKLGDSNCSYPISITKHVKPGDKPIDGDFSQKVSSIHSKPRTNACGTASSYFPLVHIPQAIGIFIGKLVYPSLGVMIILGRLANVVFYALSLYFIIEYVKIGKWAFAVIGLLPVFIHIAGSLSGDVMNTVVVFGFMALTLNAFTSSKLTKKQFIGIACFGILLALTKLPNICLLLPLLFLPSKLFHGNPSNLKKIPFNVYKYSFCVLVGIFAIAGFLLWMVIYNHPLLSNSLHNPIVGHPLHFLRILFNTYINPTIGYEDSVFDGVTGIFSYKYSFPDYMVVFSWVLMLFTLLVSNKTEEKLLGKYAGRLAISSIVAGIIIIPAVTYALYTSWSLLPSQLGSGALYAAGVQGRYFTALILLLIPLGVYCRRYINIQLSKPILLGVIVCCGCLFQLIFYIVETYYYAAS